MIVKRLSAALSAGLLILSMCLPIVAQQDSAGDALSPKKAATGQTDAASEADVQSADAPPRQSAADEQNDQASGADVSDEGAPPAPQQNDQREDQSVIVIEEVSDDEDLLISGEEDELLIEEESEGEIIISGEDEENILEAIDQKESAESPDQAAQQPQEDAPSAGQRPVIDNEAAPAQLDPGSAAESVVSEKRPAAETPKAAPIEEARSINFARNLDEYRSPKLAMFMSLIVPGAGQAYVKRYWKTAIFGAVEAGIIGASLYRRSQGIQAEADARDFADKHFSRKQFQQYYENLPEYIASTAGSEHLSDNLDSAQAAVDDIFIYDTAYFNPQSKKDNNFYSLIENLHWVQGWDDAEPALYAWDSPGDEVKLENGNHYDYRPRGSDTVWLFDRFPKGEAGDSTRVIERGAFGYSVNQLRYSGMVDDANAYFNKSGNWLLVLVVNHLASAVDALISAKAHNDALMGRQTMWRRIDIEQGISITDSDIVSRLGLRVRF